MKALVFLNGSAGRMSADQGQTLVQRVEDAFRAAGVDAEIRVTPHRQLESEVEAAVDSDADVIVAGGGDGTVSTIAEMLVGTDKPMAVLPLGTLNHFAKDLNIPLDLASACEVIAAGNFAAVDVGVVNEHVFVNNSSLGVYPRAVLMRETHRRNGISKWTAMALAVLKTFRRFPLMRVRLETDQDSVIRKSPLVFVGNNEYQLDLLNIGKRTCLDQGKLSLYVTNTQSRWGMLALTLRAFFGRLRQSRDFEDTCVTQCWIESRRRRLHVALDGEVIKLRPPLHYRIWPGALRVAVPIAVDARAADEQHERIGSAASV